MWLMSCYGGGKLVVLLWMQKPAPVAVEGESGLGLAKESEEAKQTVKGHPSRPVVANMATASTGTPLAWPPQHDNATQGQPLSHFGGPVRRKAPLGGQCLLPSGVPISKRGDQVEAPLPALSPNGPEPPRCPADQPLGVPYRDTCAAGDRAVLYTPATLASVPRNPRAAAMLCPGGSRSPRALGERPRPLRAPLPPPPGFPARDMCAVLQIECMLNSPPVPHGPRWGTDTQGEGLYVQGAPVGSSPCLNGRHTLENDLLGVVRGHPDNPPSLQRPMRRP
jgi:hypothetical protein